MPSVTVMSLWSQQTTFSWLPFAVYICKWCVIEVHTGVFEFWRELWTGDRQDDKDHKWPDKESQWPALKTSTNKCPIRYTVGIIVLKTCICILKSSETFQQIYVLMIQTILKQ